jgi:hypothetical protein
MEGMTDSSAPQDLHDRALEAAPLRLYVARPVELSLLPGEDTDERVPLPSS